MRSAEQRLVASLRIPRPLDSATLADSVRTTRHVVLAELARREGVAGLLLRDLRRAGLEHELEPAARDRLGRRYVDTAAANGLRAAALRELVAHTLVREVKIVVLKGMALIDELYGDWGLRPMTDIDLWVDGGGFVALRRALVELGYRAQPFYPQTFTRGPVTIDVHSSLLGSERIAARDRILADGQAMPFDRAERFTIGEHTAWRLDAPDTALFACLHLLKHNACRLLWLLEADALLERASGAETEALRQRAGRAGQWQAVEVAAFLARELLEAADTRSAGLAALTPDASPPALLRLAIARRRRRGKLPVWGPLVFFNAGGARTGRVLSAVETLFPRPATLRQIFGDEDSWLPTLYVRRLLQLVEMVVRH